MSDANDLVLDKKWLRMLSAVAKDKIFEKGS